MATLTSTATLSKKAVRFAALAVVAVIVIVILFRMVGALKGIIAPPAPAPATVAFGKLPKLDLTEGVKPRGGTKFLVETITGDLPSLAARVKVFKVKEPTSAFGNLEVAIDKAGKAGFLPKVIENASGVVKFADPKDESKILAIETTTQFFTVNSDYLKNPTIITSRITSAEKVQKTVETFFKRLAISDEMLPKDKITIEHYSIVNGSLEEAISLSGSNLVKVVYNVPDVDSLPIIYPNIKDPLAWGLANEKDIVSAGYFLKDFDAHNFSTYPLKSTQEALEDLRRGDGFLNKNIQTNTFAVRSVKIGYLETKKYQPYLQPVYIFESDDNLIAYVSALSNNWTN